MKRLPYPDNFFDLIYCFDVVEHINDHELRQVLCEVARVLKRRGYLLFTTPNVRKQSVLERQKELIRSPRHYTDLMHIGLRTSRRVRDIFQAEGFRIHLRYSPTLQMVQDTARETMISRLLYAAYRALGERFGVKWFGGDQAGFCQVKDEDRHFLRDKAAKPQREFADVILNWLLRRKR